MKDLAFCFVRVAVGSIWTIHRNNGSGQVPSSAIKAELKDPSQAAVVAGIENE
jgi:hypothetical protein